MSRVGGTGETGSGGDEREQSWSVARSESESDPRVRGRPCLAPNTGCTSSTDLSKRTPFGWRGERRGKSKRVQSCPLSLVRVEKKMKSGREEKKSPSPDPALVKLTWLKQSQASLPSFLLCASLALSHKLQKARCSSQRDILRTALCLPFKSQVCNHEAESTSATEED